MVKIWTGIKKGLRLFFMPDISSRRVLREGLARENLIIWGATSAVIIAVAAFLTGAKLTLYLPHYYDWRWIEVTVLELPFWAWGLFWALVTGLCLIPRLTAIATAVTFSLYYIYAAANGATIRPWGMGDLISLPYLPIYAYHYFLPMFIAFSGILVFVFYPASRRSPAARASRSTSRSSA